MTGRMVLNEATGTYEFVGDTKKVSGDSKEWAPLYTYPKTQIDSLLARAKKAGIEFEDGETQKARASRGKVLSMMIEPIIDDFLAGKLVFKAAVPAPAKK